MTEEQKPEFYTATNATESPILLHAHSPNGLLPDGCTEADKRPVIIEPGETETIDAELFIAVQQFGYIEHLVLTGGLVFEPA